MGLSEELGRILTALPGTFGVFARNLGTGEVAEVNADQVLPTESAAKTFILLHYSGRVPAGDCDPSSRVVLPDNFRLNGTGVLRYLTPGLSLCLDDLAWLMTIVSDNVATALLMLEVGEPEAVNKTMADLGLTTARLASFEEMLAGAPLIGLPRRLDQSPYAVDLGVRMPVRVFNKTGVGPTNFIDSGLFETDSACWIAAAMATELPLRTTRPDDPAPTAFAEIGHILRPRRGRGRRCALPRGPR